MIDETYFNGQRAKDFAELKQMALGIKGHLNSARAVETSSFLMDFYLDPSIYKAIKKYDNSLLVYLLLWCRNTRVKRQDAVLTVLHPYINDQETFETQEYVLEDRILGPFFLARLYTDTPDFLLFKSLMKIGGASGGYYPPQRCSVDDAQLKIMLDVILAVEDMVFSGDKKRYKILVIGSAHEVAKRSGRAYDVIAKIAPNSDVFLYDPCGANYVFSIGDTVFNHLARTFPYVSVEGYDLVLDDTWVFGQLHVNRDPEEIVFSAPHFSIKKFPEEGMPGYVYYQAFKTERKESRAVSRDIIYDYRPIPGIGSCAACDELKFLMKGQWDIGDLFMSTHKVNCITGKRRIDIDHFDFDHESWSAYSPGKLDIFKCFPWDVVSDGDRELPQVTLNEAVLRSSHLIVSRWENVPIGLVDRIFCIVIIHNGAWYLQDDQMALSLGLVRFTSDAYPCLELTDVFVEHFNWMANTGRTDISKSSDFNVRRGNLKQGNEFRKDNKFCLKKQGLEVAHVVHNEKKKKKKKEKCVHYREKDVVEIRDRIMPINQQVKKEIKFGTVREDGVKLKTRDGDQTTLKI